jgi:methyl-accepting chemotaxis protein
MSMLRFLKLKIREKILIASLLIACIPLFISNAFWFTNATSLVRSNAQQNMVTVTGQASVRVDDFLNAKLLGFLSHSQGAALLSGDQKLIQDDLLNLLLQDRDISLLSYVDTKGKEQLKVSTSQIYPKNALQDVSDTDAFKVANFQFGKEYIGPVVYTENKVPQVIIAVPIVHPDKSASLQTYSSSSMVTRPPGEFRGFLIGTVTLTRLYNSISSLKIGKTGYAYIVDKRGTILAHPDSSLIGTGVDRYPGTEIENFVMMHHMSLLEDNTMVHETKSPDQKQVVSTHKPIGRTGWGIIAEQPLDDISSDITRIQQSAIPLLLVPLIAVVFFSFFFARKIAVPLNQLVK